MKSLQRIADSITQLSRWCWILGQWVAFVLMGMVFIDVFFRRFKVAFVGSKDLIEVAFLFVCYLSFSYAWVKGDHINVDIFVGKLSPWLKKCSDIMGAIFGMFLFACLAYASYGLMRSSFRFGSVTPDLHFPHVIMQVVMLVGSLLLTMQCVITVLFELGIIKKPALYGK
jgi:TRAP-type mannitol/chloroaromatic compound transport system permease small subunit